MSTYLPEALTETVYWVFAVAAVNTPNKEPSTGLGAYVDNTAGTAIWDTLGLVAGTFEVIIDSVVPYAGTSLVTILEVNAGAATIQTDKALQGVSIPMRDGFSFGTVGGGVGITFRIRKYTAATASLG